MMLYQPKIPYQVALTDNTESDNDLASSGDITSLCPRSLLHHKVPYNHITQHQPRKKIDKCNIFQKLGLFVVIILFFTPTPFLVLFYNALNIR